MKKILFTFALGVIIFISSNTQAVAFIAFDYEENWGYYQTQDTTEYSWQYGSEFDTATESSFDWNKITQIGKAAFGASSANTNWKAGRGLAIEKTFTLNGDVNSAVLSYGIDNGLIVFLNGNLVERLNEAGSGFQEKKKKTVNPSFFKQGENVVRVLAEDHGGLTWVDLKLEGDISPVPEPATIAFFLISILALFPSKIFDLCA